jgi:hypothetical protein
MIDRTAFPHVSQRPGPPLPAVLLFAGMATVALVVAQAGVAGESAGYRLLLPVTLIVACAAGWLTAVVARERERGLRAVVAMTAITAVVGLALNVAGAAFSWEEGARAVYQPTTAAGAAGLWLMLAAAGPFLAVAGFEYRRSDGWYLGTMGVTASAWGVLIAITAVDVLRRLD